MSRRLGSRLVHFGKRGKAAALAGLFAALMAGCGPHPAASHAAAPPPSAANPDAGAQANWRSTVPKPGKPAEPSYPVPERFELDSGLSVYVLERPAGVVSLSVVVRHGQSSVPPGKSGLAALTARMLTEGTTQRSSLELAEAAESLGSSLQTDAGRDYVAVDLMTLPADLDAGVALLAEVVQKPAFKPKELERVRAEWLDSLRAERQDPARLASLAGLRLLLGEEQGAPVRGSIPDVQALTAADLRRFHARAFGPSQAALVVVGEAIPARVREIAEARFGKWKANAKPPTASRQKPGPAQTRVTLIDLPDAVQTSLFVAQPFPRRAEAGFEVREVLNNLLGGLFTSRLNQNLREQHAYTYGARSAAVATRDWGAFLVATNVESGVTAPALSELLSELRGVAEPKRGKPISSAEVARSQADLVASLAAHLEHTGRLAGDAQEQYVLGLPIDYFGEYPNRVRAVTRGEVAAEAKRRLTPEALVIVAVGARDTIQPALEKQGFAVQIGDPALVR